MRTGPFTYDGCPIYTFRACIAPAGTGAPGSLTGTM
jgi:hypothetical protein